MPTIYPTTRTIEKMIETYDMSTSGGEVNVKMLKEIFVQQNLPLVVSVAEDATGVVGRRQYDVKTTSLRGGSLPLQANGLPNAVDAVVSSAEDIINYFDKYDRASVVMVRFDPL